MICKHLSFSEGWFIVTLFTSGDSNGYLDPNLNSSWNFSPSYNVPSKKKKRTEPYMTVIEFQGCNLPQYWQVRSKTDKQHSIKLCNKTNQSAILTPKIRPISTGSTFWLLKDTRSVHLHYQHDNLKPPQGRGWEYLDLNCILGIKTHKTPIAFSLMFGYFYQNKLF